MKNNQDIRTNWSIEVLESVHLNNVEYSELFRILELYTCMGYNLSSLFILLHVYEYFYAW